MGVICGDFDEMGTRTFSSAMTRPANFHFQNDGRGNFREVGVLTGLAYYLHGQANGNMGAECGDYNLDGHLDLFVTDYRPSCRCCIGISDGIFDDVTNSARRDETFPHIKWGSGLVDFDNDGDRDLFIACGHFLDNIRKIDDTTDYRVPNILLMNAGRRALPGRVRAVRRRTGSVVESSRGAASTIWTTTAMSTAWCSTRIRGRPISRNESDRRQHWLEIRLHGCAEQSRRRGSPGPSRRGRSRPGGRGPRRPRLSKPPRDATALWMRDRVRVERVEVRWVGGGVEVLTDLCRIDQRLVLVEGYGTPLPEESGSRIRAPP